MSTKAELDRRVAELEAQLAQQVSPENLRLFSFVHDAGRLLVVSMPPSGVEELRALKAALDTLRPFVDERLLQAVAQEAARRASETSPSASG